MPKLPILTRAQHTWEHPQDLWEHGPTLWQLLSSQGPQGASLKCSQTKELVWKLQSSLTVKQ